MSKIRFFLLFVFTLALDAKAWAQSGDLFEFFEEEAQVDQRLGCSPRARIASQAFPSVVDEDLAEMVVVFV